MERIEAGRVFPNIKFETYSGSASTVAEAVQQKKHTVFWAMRFIGCRFCQYDLEMLAEQYNRFVEKDTQVYAILQSSQASIKQLKGEEFCVPYEIICDTAHDFYRELSVRAAATKEDRMPTTPEGRAKLEEKKEAVAAKHYERKTGEGEAQQLPALFIVGSDQQVEYVHYADNSIDIPDFDSILSIIDQLDCRG